MVGTVVRSVAGLASVCMPERWLDPIDSREDLDLLARHLATTDIDVRR